MKWLILMGALLWSACTPVCSQIKATRCSGSVVEICGSNKRWQRVMDCQQAAPITSSAPKAWRCAEKPEGSTCVPAGDAK